MDSERNSTLQSFLAAEKNQVPNYDYQQKLENETLENLYSPSYWSKRLSQDTVVEEYVRVTTEESVKVRKEIEFETHQYSEGENEKLDVFWNTEGPNNEQPIFVFFSGGYWQAISGEISAFVVSPIHKEGMNCVIVDYPRAPKVTVTEINHLAIESIKWIVQNLAVPSKRAIYLAGHSAGSQICGMIFSSNWFGQLCSEEKSLFKGVFHLSGIFYLPPLIETSINDPLKMNQSEAEEMSPLLHVEAVAKNFGSQKSDFKVTVIVAENDSPTFKAQGKDYSQKLVNVGFTQTKMRIVKNTDHFDVVEQLADPDYKITKFIIEVMKK